MTQHQGHTWSAGAECARHWKVFAAVGAMAILLAMLISASIPKEYSAQVKISDERKESDILLGLNNFAAWARGAINDRKGLRMPEVYAMTVTTKEFAEQISKVKLEGYQTDYYHYILNHHKTPWWEKWLGYFKEQENEHDRVIGIIQENIKSEASSIYNTTLLQVTDQDPVVAAMIVDTIRCRLENRLKDHYYTRALRDLLQVKEKTEMAELRYKKAQQTYNQFSDSHQDLTTPAAMSHEDNLLAEYDAAFGAYNQACEQLRRAQALLEKQPSTFAVLKNATVPMKESRPATIGYVMSFLFMGLTFTLWIVLGKRKYQEYKRRESWR